ncbi:TonB-dependent siderophore receptor [Nostoc sp.]|uniref:TonB-dependent siderophore receptor n=1 Tax=Nostoc sp. TaxID=1180 RepID=UPI002FFCB05D
MKGRICLPKMRLLLVASLIGYIFSFVVSEPVLAQVKTKGKESTTDIQFPVNNSGLLWQSSTPQPTPSVEVVQITGVKANPTTIGLELILQTTVGEQLQVTNRSAGNNFIADIPNAQLRLPSGEGFTFRSEKPLTGITQISVINFDSNTIRVTVVGETSLPTIELYDSDQGLIFAMASATQQGEKPQALPTPSAQKPESSTQSQPPSAQGDQPIELVVTGEQDGYSVPNATTATRTDTPLRDIPQSIQVVPQQVLKDQQVIRLDEALRNVSGVQGGETAFAAPSFTIRGFANAPVLRDGFKQYQQFDSDIPDVSNLEHIEVLKGPTSILYGQIEPGGLINLVTKQPLSQPFYEVGLQAGNYNLVRPTIDFSGPLNADKTLLYRLNATYQRIDSFLNYDTNFERVFVAPTLTWEIDKQTDLTVNVEYLHNQRPSNAGLVAAGDRILDIPFNRTLSEPDDRETSEQYRVGYNLEHRFSDNWTLRNSFRYINFDYTQTFFPILTFDEATGIADRAYINSKQRAQDYLLQTNVVGKFATGSIQHTLLFGIDLSHNYTELDTRVDFGPFPLNVFAPVYGQAIRQNRNDLLRFNDTSYYTNQLGIYLQDQIAIANNLKLLAGLRYDLFDQLGIYRQYGFDSNLPDLSQTPNAWTPRFGVVYQPIPELSVYASYSRSFKPNNAADGNTGTLLKPEQGEGWEVGTKAELLGGKLFATLAYFNITKQNVATSDPNNPFGFSIATGEQQSQGVELDVSGEILPGWNIIANYAYTDAEITKDNTFAVGNRLFNTPKNSASLWTTYTLPKGSLQGLGFGVGFNYVGEREGDLANSFVLDSYFLTNAAVFYRRNNWQVGLNFKNIFDIDYIESSDNSRTRNYPGDPFAVIGSFSIQF